MTAHPVALLVASLLLVVPGLVGGVVAGLRSVALLSVAPLLSFTALTLGIIGGSYLHWRWSVGCVVLGTLLLAALCSLVPAGHLLARRVRARRATPAPAAVAEPGRSLRERLTWAHLSGSWRRGRTLGDVVVYVGVVALAGATTLHLLDAGLPDAGAVQQSWDAVFHLNAIDRVMHTGSASPATVGQTANLFGPGAFYPPLFHAVAALVAPSVAADVPTAANATAFVAACVVWPMTVLGLVWSVIPRRAALAVAGGLTVVTTTFPSLLLVFGVLWPNLLGLAGLPAMLALAGGVLMPSRPLVPPSRAVPIGAIGAAGLYYAHPGTIFSAIAVLLPALVLALIGLTRAASTGVYRQVRPRAGRAPAAAAALVVAGLLGWAVWSAGSALWFWVDGLKEVKALRAQDWKAVEDYAQAVGEVMTLSTFGWHPLYVVGGAAVIGAGIAAFDRRLWLVAGFVLTGYLYVLAAGTDEELSMRLTGFWYNDRMRLLALLPATALPLATVGTLRVVDTLHRRVGRVLPRSGWWSGPVRTPVVAAISTLAVLAVGAVAVPVGTLAANLEEQIHAGYTGVEGKVLTTPSEEALYRSLAHQPDPGKAVTGDPFTGAVVAGTLSGRPWIFGHLRNTLDADQRLVAARFKDFMKDPAVCRAVKRLNIGYVTEDTELFPPSPDQVHVFDGLVGLAGTPGLTPVAQEGTVTAYRVAPCSG